MAVDPNAPIFTHDFVPVPDKPGCFVMIHKVTKQPFSVPAAIEAAYKEGRLTK